MEQHEVIRRVFRIGEKVWYEDDHEVGWGKVVLINGSAEHKEEICSDYEGTILTIQKRGCKSIIETTPDHVWQLAPGRTFQGKPVCWEHHLMEDAYPFFCPYHYENVFHFELD